jgi:hypothetical protein
MSGIYPESGVIAAQAQNSVDVPTVNCANELFYSTNRCQPRFDPAAANAVISEILNVVNAAGRQYDCSRLDNLALTIMQLANICTFPIIAPDSDDFLSGCFDGVSGRATMLQVMSQAPNIFSLGTVADEDFIGFHDVSTGVVHKVTIADLRSAIVPVAAGPSVGFKPVAVIQSDLVGSGGASGILDMTGWLAGVVQVMVPDNGGITLGNVHWQYSSTGSGNPNRILVSGDGGSSNNIHGESTHAIWKSTDGAWYLNNNGAALQLNTGTDLITFDGTSTGGNFQSMAVYGAVPVDNQPATP